MSNFITTLSKKALRKWTFNCFHLNKSEYQALVSKMITEMDPNCALLDPKLYTNV